MSDQSIPRLADDLLEGAGAIAEFMYGSSDKRRRVYHLVEKAKGLNRPPIIRVGSILQARKSSILQWYAERERRTSEGE